MSPMVGALANVVPEMLTWHWKPESTTMAKVPATAVMTERETPPVARTPARAAIDAAIAAGGAGAGGGGGEGGMVAGVSAGARVAVATAAPLTRKATSVETCGGARIVAPVVGTTSATAEVTVREIKLPPRPPDR